MNIYDEWKKLTLSQFWNKKILGGIMRAISEELQEVYAIQQQLRSLTDIETQEGINLDHIGDIVCLSREDAQEILMKDDAFEMTDELYRKVLRFMIALHSSSATYYDIIDGIKLIWNLEGVSYFEDRNRPATYILDLGERDIDEDSAVDARTLTIRAAGVKALYLITWLLKICHDYWRVSVSMVEYKANIPFFGSVRRIDGTLQLNGTYHLDASAEGKGQVDYRLPSVVFPHKTQLEGIQDIPQRLVICAERTEIWMAKGESAITGVCGQELAASVEDGCLAIASDGESVVEDSLSGLRVTGTKEHSVHADDYLVSRKDLYGQFQNDGLTIHYAADAEFSMEITATKVY